MHQLPYKSVSPFPQPPRWLSRLMGSRRWKWLAIAIWPVWISLSSSPSCCCCIWCGSAGMAAIPSEKWHCCGTGKAPDCAWWGGDSMLWLTAPAWHCSLSRSDLSYSAMMVCSRLCCQGSSTGYLHLHRMTLIVSSPWNLELTPGLLSFLQLSCGPHTDSFVSPSLLWDPYRFPILLLLPTWFAGIGICVRPITVEDNPE